MWERVKGLIKIYLLFFLPENTEKCTCSKCGNVSKSHLDGANELVQKCKQFLETSESKFTEGICLLLFTIDSFPTCRHIWLHWQQMTFENIATNWKLLMMTNFSFASIFSTVFNYCTFICREFSYFCEDIFRVICCRFAVCGKR